MAKSALGSQVLAEKGHFTEFSHFIRQHGLEDDDFEIISKLKSVLWAVVNSKTRLTCWGETLMHVFSRVTLAPPLMV